VGRVAVGSRTGCLIPRRPAKLYARVRDGVKTGFGVDGSEEAGQSGIEAMGHLLRSRKWWVHGEALRDAMADRRSC
jgi:hypothetical protein